MYPEYEDTEEGRALEALEHPDGEEYCGAHDCYKKTLEDHGWDSRNIEDRFGRRSWEKESEIVEGMYPSDNLDWIIPDKSISVIDVLTGKPFDFEDIVR